MVLCGDGPETYGKPAARGAPACGARSRRRRRMRADHAPPRLTRLRCVPASTPRCRGGGPGADRPPAPDQRPARTRDARVVPLVARGARHQARPQPRRLRRARSRRHARRQRERDGLRPRRAGARTRSRSRSPPRRGSPRTPAPAPGALPEIFRGNGMWIWQLAQSEGGNLAAIANRARGAGITTVFVKSSDGATNRWAQFYPGAGRGAEGPGPARLRVAVRLRQRPGRRGGASAPTRSPPAPTAS